MANFYQLYSIRHEPIQEMSKIKELHKANLNKVEPKLLEKKEKLFKTKDVSKWELEKEAQKYAKGLVENKELALELMLPRETAEVQKLKDRYVFFTNQCLREVKRTNENDTEEGREQFKTISRTMQEVNGKRREVWTRFEKEFELNYEQIKPSQEIRGEEKKQE